MGNQNPYVEEGQIAQWPKEKGQKDRPRSTKHTHKNKDRATRSPHIIGGDIRWSKRVRSSCSIRAMYMVFQNIILKVLVLDYINVPVLSTGAINAIIWSPSRIIHFSSKFDFFIGVDLVMCHALKKSTSH
jgi:hypothetical protein